MNACLVWNFRLVAYVGREAEVAPIEVEFTINVADYVVLEAMLAI